MPRTYECRSPSRQSLYIYKQERDETQDFIIDQSPPFGESAKGIDAVAKLGVWFDSWARTGREPTEDYNKHCPENNRTLQNTCAARVFKVLAQSLERASIVVFHAEQPHS
jgi:hypothetical protein